MTRRVYCHVPLPTQQELLFVQPFVSPSNQSVLFFSPTILKVLPTQTLHSRAVGRNRTFAFAFCTSEFVYFSSKVHLTLQKKSENKDNIFLIPLSTTPPTHKYKLLKQTQFQTTLINHIGSTSNNLQDKQTASNSKTQDPQN